MRYKRPAVPPALLYTSLSLAITIPSFPSLSPSLLLPLTFSISFLSPKHLVLPLLPNQFLEEKRMKMIMRKKTKSTAKMIPHVRQPPVAAILTKA